MEQFFLLSGKDINALGDEGYILGSANHAAVTDDLPFGSNTIILSFVADGKEQHDYAVCVPADHVDVLETCIGKEPVEVFVILWQLKH